MGAKWLDEASVAAAFVSHTPVGRSCYATVCSEAMASLLTCMWGLASSEGHTSVEDFLEMSNLDTWLMDISPESFATSWRINLILTSLLVGTLLLWSWSPICWTCKS